MAEFASLMHTFAFIETNNRRSRLLRIICSRCSASHWMAQSTPIQGY